MDPQTLCLTRQAASLFMIQKALNLLQRLVVEFITLWDNEGLSVNVVLNWWWFLHNLVLDRIPTIAVLIPFFLWMQIPSDINQWLAATLWLRAPGMVYHNLLTTKPEKMQGPQRVAISSLDSHLQSHLKKDGLSILRIPNSLPWSISVKKIWRVMAMATPSNYGQNF